MGESTHRVRVQEQLVLLAAGIGTWRYDVAADTFSGDDLARQLLGLGDRDDSIGCEALAKRVHRESAAKLLQFLRSEKSPDETHSFVIRIPRTDADDRFVVVRARLMPNSDSTTSELVGIAMDDTEHQRLARNLTEREGWLKTLVHGVPQSFMYMDRNQRVLFANDVFLRNTNWTGKNVRGKHLSEIHGELYASRVEYIERALNGETVSYEALGRKGNGMGFFHHEFKPNLDSKGDVIGIFATATDISDRLAIERELETKQAELVRSNRDLEQFAYVASHDLKAPLRAIEVLVHWLREDLVEYQGGDVHENLDLLAQRTRRLGRLLDDLLTYSRVGRKVGQIVGVDWNQRVRDLADLMGVPANFSVEITSELPVFATHAGPLEQVFRNLIGNAIKHHPGPEGRVTIWCEEQDDHFLFCVADDGEGIPQEYAERVFQMFQTLKPRDEMEGSGMGLAIVSRIVEWQGGRIWLEPGADGRGTVFKFQWKRATPHSDDEHVEEESVCRQATK